MTHDNPAYVKPDEPQMEDILRVRAALQFAIQYDPKANAAFDRILEGVDSMANRIEELEDDADYTYTPIQVPRKVIGRFVGKFVPVEDEDANAR